MNNFELDEIRGKSADLGRDMFRFMEELYPICRSITGEGVRETHRRIREHIPIRTSEVPSGTKVFDWTVPKEWNIRDAYVIGPDGKKIIDFKKSNLHVLNYSVPMRAKMTLEELKPHLHTLPARPGVIPYLTSYYKENWGFCLTHNQYKRLKRGTYEVVIDSSLEPGSMTMSELYMPGARKDEILISTYTCHPSVCNDNLSGVVLATFLAKLLSKFSMNYSYRFIFIPETIGAITWLAFNEKGAARIKHGLVATCVGDPGCLTYKKSRRGDADIDQAVINTLRFTGRRHKVIDFQPVGSDERQFCSPGFNLPVGSLMRTPYAKYPEYHTSADTLDLMKPKYLADSLMAYLSVLYTLENNATYQNLNPKCEPQLGKRGLYSVLGSQTQTQVNQLALLWVLNFSDGENSLLDISDRSGLDFSTVKFAADSLAKCDLLRPFETKKRKRRSHENPSTVEF